MIMSPKSQLKMRLAFQGKRIHSNIHVPHRIAHHISFGSNQACTVSNDGVLPVASLTTAVPTAHMWVEFSPFSLPRSFIFILASKANGQVLPPIMVPVQELLTLLIKITTSLVVQAADLVISASPKVIGKILIVWNLVSSLPLVVLVMHTIIRSSRGALVVPWKEVTEAFTLNQIM